MYIDFSSTFILVHISYIIYANTLIIYLYYKKMINILHIYKKYFKFTIPDLHNYQTIKQTSSYISIQKKKKVIYIQKINLIELYFIR